MNKLPRSRAAGSLLLHEVTHRELCITSLPGDRADENLSGRHPPESFPYGLAIQKIRSSVSGTSQSVKRGEKLAQDRGYKLIGH